MQMTLELFWSTLEEQLGPLGKQMEEGLICCAFQMTHSSYLSRTADTVQGHSPLTGAEFHTWVARPDLGLQNSPCAVCYVPRGCHNLNDSRQTLVSSFLDLGVCQLPGVQVQAARLPKA